MTTPPLRDKIAHQLANAALRLATDRYRKQIAGSIEYGLRAAARDIAMEAPSPVAVARNRCPATGCGLAATSVFIVPTERLRSLHGLCSQGHVWETKWFDERSV